ncbi:MAG TPA: DUF2523 family protein [Lysobacter sp.]
MIWSWIRRGVGYAWDVFFGGIGRIGAKVLSTYGVSLVSVNSLLPPIKAYIVQYANALPPKASQLLGALGFDVFVTIILSAVCVAYGSRLIPMPTSAAKAMGAVRE